MIKRNIRFRFVCFLLLVILWVKQSNSFLKGILNYRSLGVNHKSFKLSVTLKDQWKQIKSSLLKQKPIKKKKPFLPLHQPGRRVRFNEQKYEDKFSKSLLVSRMYDNEPRRKLKTFSVGQKIVGQVISFTDYGMYVDIGSKKDGLVHVKDMSRYNYVNDHRALYSPGQNVTVWIKFVDSPTRKLGLQLFPPIDKNSTYSKIPVKDISKLKVGDQVNGVVTRLQDYGVFVYIGAKEEAYLHKRKMNLQPRQLHLKPVEIFPLGSTVSAYVFHVERSRIMLTTYSPDEWEDMIPAPKSRSIEDNIMNSRKITPDNIPRSYPKEDEQFEEYNFNRRAREDAANRYIDDEMDEREFSENEMKSFMNDENNNDNNQNSDERVIADDDIKSLGLDEFIENDEDDDDGVVIEERDLSETEIEEIRKSHLKDFPELAETSEEQMQQKPKFGKTINHFISNLRIVANDELFEDLARRPDIITYNDIKNWDLVEALLASNDPEFTERDLKDIFRVAGGRGHRWQLDRDRFNDFMDILSDKLGLAPSLADLDEAEDRKHEFDETNDDDSEDVNVLIDETIGVPEPSREIKGISHEEAFQTAADELNRNQREQLKAMASSPNFEESVSSPQEISLKQKTAESGDASPVTMSEHFYSSLSGRKNHVTITDILKWDFARSIMRKNELTDIDVIKLFNESSPILISKNKVKVEARLNQTGFVIFTEKLRNWSKNNTLNRTLDTALDVVENVVPNVEIERLGSEQDSVQKPGPTDSIHDDTYTLDIFKKLSLGNKNAKFAQISNWGIFKELLDNSILSPSELKKYFVSAGGFVLPNKVNILLKRSRGNLAIDYHGFKRLLETVTPLLYVNGDSLDETKSMQGNAKPPEVDIKPMQDNTKPPEIDFKSIGNVSKSTEGNPNFVEKNTMLPHTNKFGNDSIKSTHTGNKLILEDYELSNQPNAAAQTIQDDLKTNEINSEYQFVTDYFANDQADDYDLPLNITVNIEDDAGNFTYNPVDPKTLSDDELLKSVFDDLSKGKPYLSKKNLQSWNFVEKVLDEGVMTEKEFDAKFKEYCTKYKRGLTSEGFDGLINYMINKIKEGVVKQAAPKPKLRISEDE